MAKEKNMSIDEINRRMKEEMDAVRRKYKGQGYNDSEIDDIMRDYFVQKKAAKKKTMTAAKGGMAKKKMMRGGVAKKKMRGGGMVKMAKKKMMRGGMAKKKK
jgi:hypothetical protein